MPSPSSVTTISDASVTASVGTAMSTCRALASHALATNSPITGGSVEYICNPKCLIVPMSNFMT